MADPFDPVFGDWRFARDGKAHLYAAGAPLCGKPVGPPQAPPGRNRDGAYVTLYHCPVCLAAQERRWVEMYPCPIPPAEAT